jgi:hypothetical protein
MTEISSKLNLNTLQNAFRSAAKKTDISFDFLVKTAARESGFQSSAKATGSSAAGLFQFIEQTWLGMVSRHGSSYGLAKEAASIQQDEAGKFSISSPAERNRILGLRHDPQISTAMAAELTAENQKVLQTKLGRSPTESELYIAHFMGAGKAASLLSAAETTPDLLAFSIFPAEAKANPTIFYDSEKQPRTVSQVIADLGRLHGTNDAQQPELLENTIPSRGRVNLGSGSFAARSSAGGGFYSPLLRLSPTVVQLLAELSAPKAPGEPKQ